LALRRENEPCFARFSFGRPCANHFAAASVRDRYNRNRWEGEPGCLLREQSAPGHGTRRPFGSSTWLEYILDSMESFRYDDEDARFAESCRKGGAGCILLSGKGFRVDVPPAVLRSRHPDPNGYCWCRIADGGHANRIRYR